MNGRLRFDGEYHHESNTGTHYLLRFYEAGIVWSWFSSRHPDATGVGGIQASEGYGEYTLSGNKISFYVLIRGGMIQYHGELVHDKIKCKIKSSEISEQMNWTYTFRKQRKASSKCKNCGKTVPTNMTVCPHCKEPK